MPDTTRRSSSSMTGDADSAGTDTIPDPTADDSTPAPAKSYSVGQPVKLPATHENAPARFGIVVNVTPPEGDAGTIYEVAELKSTGRYFAEDLNG
jgi:hypothetical protein